MAPGRKRGANKGPAKGELRLGDLVLAKVKGFPAWPAKIGRPEDWDHAPDPKKYFVQFFGTQEIAFVTPPDIQVFTSEAKNKLSKRCQGKTVKYFSQAVEEISAAFEESQNDKSDNLGSETLLKAVEHSLNKPKTLDGTDHRESNNDGNSDKLDSRADPCLHKLVENNGAETKPDIGEEDSSLGGERLEHGSPDLTSKVADFDEKIDGVTCTEHRDGAGKNSVISQRIIKKIAGDSDKRCEDKVHRVKHVPDSRAATDKNLIGPNQKLKGSVKEPFDNKVGSDLSIASCKKSKKLLKEKPSAGVSSDKHEYALGSKNGILGKKKSVESELGKSASGAAESKRAAKRQRSEDAKDQRQCKSKRLRPAGEGKAEGSDSTAVVSILKPEIVLGVSARGGKIQYDEEVVAYTKRCKQTVEHTSVSSLSGSRDKEGTIHPERKISSSSAGYLKAPAAQLPKRRRAVYIYDEDDDEDSKTPVHGGNTNIPKATSASTDVPKSAKASHDTSIKAKLLAGSAESAETGKVPLFKHNKDASLSLPDSVEGLSYNSPMGKPVTELLTKSVKPILRSPKKFPQLVSFKKQVTAQSKTAKVSGVGMPDSVEGLSNSSSMGKPVIKLPTKNVKQILRSPKKSPQLVSTNDQVAGQNKLAKVSGGGMSKKCQGDSFKDAVAGSDGVSSSQSQTANQRSKPALGEKLTDTPKIATRLNDAGLSRDTSVDLSAGKIDVNQEKGSAPLISSGMSDSFSSMKDLIAAAQAKRKQAHTHTSPLVNLDHKFFGIGETQLRNSSPFMVQNVSSSAGDAMVIVAQGRQEDQTPSIHGHQSASSNQAEIEENEERRVNSGHMSVGDAGTEAAISRDAFEGMIETLSRTKESIGRATRQAIDCAKYGIASEVVELLIRKLEREPHFRRKVDLFFLVDSITQCSHSQKAGALYIPTVQAALPRLLGAAAPPGTGARENRHQCRKVLRLWLERKIFPDSLLRRYIGDISTSGGDATAGFTLRRPSRSERAVDDPIREMEGMLVDEYGSNASFQLPGFLSSHTFGDDEEEEDLPTTSWEVKNTHIEDPVHALGKLEAHDSSSDKPHCVLEAVNGVREMEDASYQPRDEEPSYVGGIETKEDSPAATTATELPHLPEGSPPLPHESPPSPPPLPPSLPPSSPPPPPSSPPQLPPPPPLSEQCSFPPPAPLPPPQSSITQPSKPSYPSLPLQPGFAPPSYPVLQHEYQISMQRSSIVTSNQIVKALVNTAHGRHADDDVFYKHKASLQNHRLRPSNTSFGQSPGTRNLATAPSSRFSLPSRIVQSQPERSSFPRPYPFPSQPVDVRRHMNEDPWRMPSNARRTDTQPGAWISGRNSLPGSLTVTDGFFQPLPERPPSGTMGYQLAANNLHAGPTSLGHTASQMLPSRPDIPSAARWRPS